MKLKDFISFKYHLNPKNLIQVLSKPKTLIQVSFKPQYELALTILNQRYQDW